VVITLHRQRGVITAIGYKNKECIMNTEIPATKKIINSIFLIFLLIYPNLYIPVVNLLVSYSFPRLFLLLIVSIFAILIAKNILDSKLFLFFIVLNLILSTISLFNPNEDEPIFTILGNDSRIEGVLYQILLIFFIVIAYFYIKKNTWGNLFLTLNVALSFQAIIIFQQYIQNPLEIFGIPLTFVTYGEVSGIVGRAAFAASLMLPIVFLGFIRLYDKSLIVSFISLLTILFSNLAINLTENRSSIIAATFALTIFLFFNINKLKNALLISLCILIVNFGTQILPGNLNANRNLSDPQTFETRIEMWKIAVRLLPESWGFPIWGGGTGAVKLNIAERLPIRDLMVVLQKEYKWQSNNNIKKIELLSPKTAPIRQKAYKILYKDGSTKIAFQVIDRTHNFFLDRVYSIGLIGAIFWMIFYIYPIFAYFRLKPYQKTFEQLAVTMALIAIQFYYIFWFSVMQVEPIHVTVALMAWVGLERARAVPNPKDPISPL
jgi:O-antigen ligase